MIHPTDPKKLNKKEGQHKDASNPLRMGEENNCGRQRERGTWVGEGRKKGKRSRIGYGARQERSPQSQENEIWKWKYKAVRGGRMGRISRKS